MQHSSIAKYPALTTVFGGDDAPHMCSSYVEDLEKMAGQPNDLRADHIDAVVEWESDGRHNLIIRFSCYDGSGGFGFSIVMHVTAGSSGRIAVLISGSAGGVPTDPIHRIAIAQRWFSTGDDSLTVYPLGGALVLLGTRARPEAALLDLRTKKRVHADLKLVDVSLMTAAHLTNDGRHLVQINRDGAVHVHRVNDGKTVLSGAVIDDEVIMVSPEGLFDASFEGAYSVNVRFPGLHGSFGFHQFEKKLRRPGLVAAVLNGQAVAPPESIAEPPHVEAALASGKLTMTARSASSLREIAVYVDGRPVQRRVISGREARLALPIRTTAGASITAVATDGEGLTSRPVVVRAAGERKAAGTLHAIIVGINAYKDPTVPPLSAAVADAEVMSAALVRLRGTAYSRVQVVRLLDRAATPDAVTTALSTAVGTAGPDDTVAFFFAGHGLQGANGELFLVTSGTRPSDLVATALAWRKVTQVLTRSQARVAVILDACHAGLAGRAVFAANDAAARELMTATGAPITVLAASKGRQRSEETGGNGRFTRALVDVLTVGRAEADIDKDGALTATEVYAAVKRSVQGGTAGRQTPWLARSQVLGDIPLF